jgi:hypothetical protein
LHNDRLTGGGLVHNLEFSRFARHYGVQVRVYRPYRAQTKGNVERPIRYLRENFLYGRPFLGDGDLAAQVSDWLTTVANVRVHATTKWVPAERFAAVEQPVLRPLPIRAYRPLVLPPAHPGRPGPTAMTAVPRVPVERRALATYAALASAAGGEL